jgi:hypothetical protein
LTEARTEIAIIVAMYLGTGSFALLVLFATVMATILIANRRIASREADTVVAATRERTTTTSGLDDQLTVIEAKATEPKNDPYRDQRRSARGDCPDASAQLRGLRERLIWLADAMADRLAAMRGPGEDYSNAILRIAAQK